METGASSLSSEKQESKGIKSFLSAKEKKELIQFIAATGENYQRYLEYCERRGWRTFTEKYLHTWIQRHRPKIQDARNEHREEVRKMSMYNRERRVDDLETLADQLKKQLSKSSEDPKLFISLSEQLRKTLEAIAKERGEWLKSEVDVQAGASVRDRLLDGIRGYLTDGKQESVIEGEVRVIT